MSISIYNTLTRKLEEFKPIRPKEVRIYVCGVTVYDECHLGHARSAFIFDFIRKYFIYCGYKVIFVKNITDVDDKIINKARQEADDKNSALFGSRLNDAVKKIAERYIKAYYDDMEALGIAKANKEPKATEHIKEIINMIRGLIDKGYAYAVNGDVYFEVRKFARYGELSNQNKDQLLEGVRVDTSEKKRDPLDFALWKSAKADEPEWDSPWGNGRPGWHIECSAMSTKYLGDNFDIHGGGRDLIFPHHENETAQSECATGKPFANYWIHNGLLAINGEKMSKSLGNYVSIKDVLARYPADVLKIFFMGTHYSHPIDFSWEKMEAAKNAYERILILFDKIDRRLAGKKIANLKSSKEIDEMRKKFEDAMNIDFSSPLALGVIFDLVGLGNKILDRNEDASVIIYLKNTLFEFSEIFGLSFKIVSSGLSDDRIQRLVEARIKAKRAKNFVEADDIRRELEEKGVILEDGKDKTYWRRKV